MHIERAYQYVKWFLVAAIALVGIFMVVMASIVRYTRFISKHPVKFIVETLLVGVLGSLPIFVVSKHRDALTISTTTAFVLLSLKFMGFWCLMELAGANAMFFMKKHHPR